MPSLSGASCYLLAAWPILCALASCATASRCRNNSARSFRLQPSPRTQRRHSTTRCGTTQYAITLPAHRSLSIRLDRQALHRPPRYTYIGRAPQGSAWHTHRHRTPHTRTANGRRAHTLIVPRKRARARAASHARVLPAAGALGQIATPPIGHTDQDHHQRSSFASFNTPRRISTAAPLAPRRPHPASPTPSHHERPQGARLG